MRSWNMSWTGHVAHMVTFHAHRCNRSVLKVE